MPKVENAKMLDLFKRVIHGFAIGIGFFLSYVLFVCAIKYGLIPEEKDLSLFFSSHKKEKFVHAIGVYEGDYPDGKPHSYGYHPDGKIDVTVKNNPNASAVVLLLMSYEPVNWNINVQKGAKIEKIILSNYEGGSKVSGIDDVPVVRESLGYSYERNAILALNEKVKVLVGADIKTAQGGYHGKIFEVF